MRCLTEWHDHSTHLLNHGTTEIFFNDMAIPSESLIGEEGEGFKYIHGMNAERALIASECIGEGRFSLTEQRNMLASGADQVSARAHIELEAAAEMVAKAVNNGLGQTWRSCWPRKPVTDARFQVHGGFGAEEYDIERPTVAPICHVATHVLGLPGVILTTR